MENDERDAQGIAVDEWCWSDMIRDYVATQERLAELMTEPLRHCEKCQGEYLASQSDAVTVAMFCSYGCERAFSRVRSI